MTFECKKNCGECCGIIAIPKELAKRTEHLAQVKPIEIIPDNKENIYVITKDMLCVYLNRENKECVIHKDRPRICRIYGLIPSCPCPYFKINGEKRELWEKRLIQTQINSTVNRAIDLAKTKIQKKEEKVAPKEERKQLIKTTGIPGKTKK